MTAVISRNMNLEFMCCILYGLSEIYVKPLRKVKLSEDTIFGETHEFTITKQMSGISNIPFLAEKGLKK
jgi:hypothetical protein